ncbi:MAG: flavodoxin-dependent (E)-4-hydroxy-3-methylbut-2-enyl-diphosphate synthase [Pseudomonadota bacterium]
MGSTEASGGEGARAASASARNSRQIKVGPVTVGGGAPVRVQSMCSTDTRDPEATLSQIGRLHAAGCEIVRVAVPDEKAADALAAIKQGSPIPVIADIHFDFRLALRAARAGVDGLRINPGNIGGEDKVRAVVEEAGGRGLPIRIGVNAGSVEKDLLKHYGRPGPEAMVASALRHLEILERLGFRDVKISLKSSDILDTIAAYRLLATKTDVPFHLGVTEAGPLIPGTVKSALGIGLLLFEGTGDTIRVSLTRDPVDEVRVAWDILRALHLRARGAEIISCPTCGRCQVNLFAAVEEVEQRLRPLQRILKVAVMGCVVNGPGEAREADVGIAGGKGTAILFKKGRVVRKVPEAQMVLALLAEIEAMTGERL